MDNKVRLQVLGSSSRGNATALWGNKKALLVDCGLGKKYIQNRLKKLNINYTDIQGVLITHGHSDHVRRAAFKLMLDNEIKIYCHEIVAEILKLKFKIAVSAEKNGFLKTFKTGEFMEFEHFRVRGFEVVHDTHCFGFNIVTGTGEDTRKVTVATDLGNTKNGITDNFINSDIIIIESNYDKNMLLNSSRPGWLKSRISDRSHLSNRECAKFIQKVIKKSMIWPRAIILAHISQECNTGLLAQNTVKEVLSFEMENPPKVFLTYDREVSKIISLF